MLIVNNFISLKTKNNEIKIANNRKTGEFTRTLVNKLKENAIEMLKRLQREVFPEKVRNQNNRVLLFYKKITKTDNFLY